jgi:hypothetical protein
MVAQIEYRLHWCDEDGDSADIEIVEGKHWRYVRKTIEECKKGLHDEFDNNGLRYGWIERVERWFVKVFCQNGIGNWVYDEDQDYETLWEREGLYE